MPGHIWSLIRRCVQTTPWPVKGQKEFEQLKDHVKALSKEVPVARDALANGLYQVISNGVPESNWMYVSFNNVLAYEVYGNLLGSEESLRAL